MGKYTSCDSYDDYRKKKHKYYEDNCHSSSERVIKVYCDCKKEEKVSPSAFRAVSLAQQNVTALTNVKVLYPIKEFDLNNEYNVTTSVFRPKTDGIYALNASVNFTSTGNVDYNAGIHFSINEIPVGEDDEFWRTIVAGSNGIIASTQIVLLRAGEPVEVFFISTAPGQINATRRSTQFSATLTQVI
ncbi:hypothetical protein D0U04_20650 [Bacillus clarus]|uniref:C1q domain protein n=1 Tax=Bacillus clarus TaxID=2338372 RepID=A0A090YK01_9BACI|nr:hypothetical protein [Bacillus clarus]KFM99103.1 hypothetical protein DJ93_5205 [Bacillus clarus]RFT64998.1 hypothetical protein D0U04_20650 [Bacillus clarus]